MTEDRSADGSLPSGSVADSRTGWYRDAFARPYLTVYAHRDETAAAHEAAFVAAELGVTAGERLLDLGCGAGRHSRALAARGAQVTGLDLSAELLERAAADAWPTGASLRDSRTRDPEIHYVRGDFRALPFGDGMFSHVASLFTAFGYFDDAGDLAQLRGVARVLRHGGRFLLDFLNAARVRSTLVPRSERELGGYRIVEERAIRSGRVEKHVAMEPLAAEGGSERLTWCESVRLYDRAELDAMLRGLGLTPIRVFGDLSGAPWTADSPRCVLVCTRGEL